ncbi:MAG: apolipoprotein N-acyltransferase, partial [Chlamydiia bacterium]|nr:apolipoprotein N-acyltransferase [Chlamydiia bacterium]
QWASIGGVFWLSFWVMFVNLLAYRIVQAKNKIRASAIWCGCALLPYFFGWVHPFFIQRWMEEWREIRVALIQTAMLPEQRNYTRLYPLEFIHPIDQWNRVLDLLKASEAYDLIVLPESAFPYGAGVPLMAYEPARLTWLHHYGDESERALPPFEPPYVFLSQVEGKERRKVSNAFFAQALANQFRTDVIIGLDDQDAAGKYNAAFHFRPGARADRYEKRILVPVAEYLPLKGVNFLAAFYAKNYHIFDSCTPGREAKVFGARIPIAPSICYEETYSSLIREQRVKGAKLLVNVSNDVWYPDSNLPEQHFYHGRIRAAENGVFLVRACNTGVTAVVDCFGKSLAMLAVSDHQPGVLDYKFPLRAYPTLYMLWGDTAILALSVFFLIAYFGKKLLLRNRKLS